MGRGHAPFAVKAEGCPDTHHQGLTRESRYSGITRAGGSRPHRDGRGAAEPQQTRAPHRSRWFLWLVVGLLASVFRLAAGGQQQVKVPFSPYSCPSCNPPGVTAIASKGDTIQGG